jgi:hypothetical protein
MDVWEVPVSSCPGLDGGPLMDVGPQRAEDFGLRAHVKKTDARNAPRFRIPFFPGRACGGERA